MLEMLEMEFMQRAWLAGLMMALTCPLIGSFLVLRRQSLIGDGLGHIAFAGVAGGALYNISPVLSAAVATILGALAIETVRVKLSETADMVLAIFFYSGMGLAVIFVGLNDAGGFNLSSILFGSLMTVSRGDLLVVGFLSLLTMAFVYLFYRPLQYLTFDETSAQVAGLPVKKLNLLLAMLTALTVSLSMRIVGLLLVSAMMVIPVACALQTAKSFRGTIISSLIYGFINVTAGLTFSYYANLAPGGTIVVVGSLLFLLSVILGKPKVGKTPLDEKAICPVCRQDSTGARDISKLLHSSGLRRKSHNR